MVTLWDDLPPDNGGMARQISGRCVRAGCEQVAGFGHNHLLCSGHADELAVSAHQIISVAAPDTMRMHEGPPATLHCGHSVSAGDHLVGIRGQWMCQACALA